MKFPMDTLDFESLLRDLRHRSVAERTNILLKVRRSKNPALGRFLLEELPNVPENPVTLFDYASALIEVAAATPGEGAAGRDGGALPDPRAGTTAALGMLARKVERFHSVMSEPGWGGILMKIERLREVDPSLFDTDPGAAALGGIRAGLNEELLKAMDLGQGYLAGAGGFRLARAIADEGTHEVLIRLLGQWDVVRKRFPDTPAREDLSALMVLSRTLLQPACPSHGREAAERLCGRLHSERTPDGRRRLGEHVRSLAQGRDVPGEIRAVLADAIGGLDR
jgi:hypothetical protein